MPRWKSTKNIFIDGGEVFDENWMNHSTVQAPPSVPWPGDVPIRFDLVDIWEVIAEQSGGIGVYAAWSPYAEYYIVIKDFKLAAEFEGLYANTQLEKYLIEQNIPYPKI